MYMSYCRFEGTRHEMDACFGDVQEHIDKEAPYEVSEREIREFRRMVHNMVEFLQETEILDEYGEVDDSVLDEICTAMQKGYEE